MDISYSIDPAARLIRVVVKADALDMEVVHAHLEELRRDPQFDNAYRRIIDLRAVTVVPTAEVIRRVVQWVTPENPERPRRAFVADVTALYGMFRMLEIMSEPTGHENRAFRTMEEAERWLGLR